MKQPCAVRDRLFSTLPFGGNLRAFWFTHARYVPGLAVFAKRTYLG